MGVLIPKQVWVGSEAKFFGLDKGASDGSKFEILFEVPEGTTKRDLRVQMLQEKKELDVLVLYAEYAKGTMDSSLFKERRQHLRATYDKLIEAAKKAKPDGSREDSDVGEGGEGSSPITG